MSNGTELEQASVNHQLEEHPKVGLMSLALAMYQQYGCRKKGTEKVTARI